MNTALLMLVPLLLCVLLLLVSCRLLFNLGWIIGWLRGTAGLIFLAATVVGSLLAWDLKSFSDTGVSQPLAVVSFAELAPQRWSVDVTGPDSYPVMQEIEGELWTFAVQHLLIDVQDYQFSFARPQLLYGRYLSLEKEQSSSKEVSDYALHKPLYDLDSWALLLQADRLRYISAEAVQTPYLPLQDGAIYEIWLMEDELDIRPVNEPAQLAISVQG